MSISRVTRALAVVTALAAVMLVGAVSASAAGKPETKGLTETSNTITQITPRIAVNPNGAATTYYIQYKQEEAISWQKTSTKSLGSGTSFVNLNGFAGLIPGTSYLYQAVASNSYGTTYSVIWNGTTSRIRNFNETNEAMRLISAGTATISVPTLGYSISCSEHGYGSTGAYEGKSDYYRIELTNCSVPGYPKCSPSVSPLKLGNSLQSEGKPLTEVIFPETCPILNMQLPPAPFVNSPLSSFAVQQPVTLTAQTSFGENPVTITLNSTWEMESREKFGEVHYG